MDRKNLNADEVCRTLKSSGCNKRVQADLRSFEKLAGIGGFKTCKPRKETPTPGTKPAPGRPAESSLEVPRPRAHRPDPSGWAFLRPDMVDGQLLDLTRLNSQKLLDVSDQATDVRHNFFVRSKPLRDRVPAR